MADNFDDVRAALAAATEGEWKLTRSKSDRWQISNGRVQIGQLWDTTTNRATANGDCITLAHNRMPALLAELDAALAEASRMREAVTACHAMFVHPTGASADYGYLLTAVANARDAVRDALSGVLATSDWLAARDARMKREGAAEWLSEYIANVRKESEDEPEAVWFSKLVEKLKSLREGK